MTEFRTNSIEAAIRVLSQRAWFDGRWVTAFPLRRVALRGPWERTEVWYVFYDDYYRRAAKATRQEPWSESSRRYAMRQSANGRAEGAAAQALPGAAAVTALLSVTEAATFLNVSATWVRRHRHRLGAVRVGRLVRFDPVVLSQRLQIESPATERPLKRTKGDNMLQRNRYQRGSVVLYRGKKTKTWYGSWREDVIDGQGKLRRRQRNARLGSAQELPTKALAREALRTLMGACLGPRTEMTFTELVERFKQVQVPTMKASSADYALRKLRGALMNRFSTMPISRIGRFEVEAFLGDQAKRYSRNTLRGFRSSLSSLLGWAVGCGWLDKNPCLGVKLPRVCGGRRVTRQV